MSYVSKVAGFYRSNHRMRSVKKVFLEISKNTFFTEHLRTTASGFFVQRY